MYYTSLSGSTLAAAMNSIQMINMGTGLPFSQF
jgi:hypothetical protein